jgi:hypothetical protein
MSTHGGGSVRVYLAGVGCALPVVHPVVIVDVIVV